MNVIFRLVRAKWRLLDVPAWGWSLLFVPLVLWSGSLLLPTAPNAGLSREINRAALVIVALSRAWELRSRAAPFSLVSPRTLGTYRALPASRRHIAIANALDWILPLLALAALSTALRVGFADRPRVLAAFREHGLIFDARSWLDVVGVWSLGVPAVALGAFAPLMRAGGRTRPTKVIVAGVVIPLLLVGLLDSPIVHIAVALVLTASLLCVDERAFGSFPARRSPPIDTTSSTSTAEEYSHRDESVSVDMAMRRLGWKEFQMEVRVLPVLLVMIAIPRLLTGHVPAEQGYFCAASVAAWPILKAASGHWFPAVSPIRNVLARLPVSPADRRRTALRLGAAAGAGYAAVIATIVVVTAGGGTAAQLDALRLSTAAVVSTTSAYLARVAPIGTCPHYGKLAAVSGLLLGLGGPIVVMRAPGTVVFLALHLAICAVLCARMGARRRVR